MAHRNKTHVRRLAGPHALLAILVVSSLTLALVPPTGATSILLQFSVNPDSPEVGETTTFEDLSTDSDGTIMGATWDFGDGTILDVTYDMLPAMGHTLGVHEATGLLGDTPLDTVCFYDTDGTGTFDSGDAVYGHSGPCDAVRSNDVRLAPSGIHAAGTQVRATHADFGNGLTAFASASIGSYDADGDGAWTVGDALYLDAAGNGVVDVHDVRLTAFGIHEPGSLVAAGQADINNQLSAGGAAFAPTNWRLLDAYGGGTWSAGDGLYLDADDDGFSTPADVRLATHLGDFGTLVQRGDADAVHALEPTPPFAEVCHVDDDGSGSHNPGEPVYASQSPCADDHVRVGDVRLSAVGGHAAGTRVAATHGDFGDPVRAFGARVDMYDADGDNVASLGDLFYVARDPLTVTVGDVRLNAAGPFAPGSVVAAGDFDVDLVLAGTPSGAAVSSWRVFDADGSQGWTAGDTVYVDLSGDGFATAGDLRIGTAGTGLSHGQNVQPEDADAVGVLRPAGFSAVCFVDDDGSGTYQAGEPVYATTSTCGGTVGGNDLRLTVAHESGPGTQVRAVDTDFGHPYTAFPAAAVRAYDADGDGTFSLGDTLYVDPDSGSTLVNIGDIRLSAWGALRGGSVVEAGDSDINNALGSAALGAQPTAWTFDDHDGDGFWSRGDVAYADMGGDGFTTAADLRLAPTEQTLSPGPKVVTHTFTAAGGHVVSLTVYDDQGNTASGKTTILVQSAENVPPLAALEASADDGTTLTPFTFQDRSTDPDGSVVARSWKVDGVTQSATSVSIERTFTSAGWHEVCLTVTDQLGATDEACTLVFVRDAVMSGRALAQRYESGALGTTLTRADTGPVRSTGHSNTTASALGGAQADVSLDLGLAAAVADDARVTIVTPVGDVRFDGVHAAVHVTCDGLTTAAQLGGLIAPGLPPGNGAVAPGTYTAGPLVIEVGTVSQGDHSASATSAVVWFQGQEVARIGHVEAAIDGCP